MNRDGPAPRESPSAGRRTRAADGRPGLDSQKRRRFLKLMGSSGAAAVIGADSAGAAEPEHGEAWSIVVLPDTQGYAESPEHFGHAQRQTAWVVDQREAAAIVFVSHVGDVVEHGDDRREWERMDAAMARLAGHVPYSVVPGDHDWFVEEDRRSATRYFRQYFGASRYRDRSWFGGSGPFDLSFYQQFSAGGYTFLHLGLEWEAPGEVDDPDTPLGWARSVLDRHADLPTIITTHTYLQDGDRPGRTTDVQETHGDGSSGERLWDELVRPHPQVFLVLCGDSHSGRGTNDGEHHQVSMNGAGMPVFELLADYQDYPEGGNGWLRRVRFVPEVDGPDRIEVRTYSPSLDAFQSDDASEFTFQLDFNTRFGPFTERRTFRQGGDGYAGTVDTVLREADPHAVRADAPTLTVDMDDPHGSGQTTQVLLRFDDLIGGADWQVPPGGYVARAMLRLWTTDGGDGGRFHRLRIPWEATATWDSFGQSGIETDGETATAAPDATVGPVETGPTPIDVTESVRTWVADGDNWGWVILPRGGDGWDFHSAAGPEPPELIVAYRS